jgi:hypothetical protein
MVRFFRRTEGFVLPDYIARDVLEKVHADAPGINVPSRVGQLQMLMHVMHVCSYMYKNEFDQKDVESLSEKRAPPLGHKSLTPNRKFLLAHNPSPLSLLGHSVIPRPTDTQHSTYHTAFSDNLDLTRLAGSNKMWVALVVNTNLLKGRQGPAGIFSRM